MAHYYSLGQIPPKRHTQFRQPNGELYHEELFSTFGFDDNYSLLYHTHPPTKIKQVGEAYSVEPEIGADKQLKPRSFNGFNVPGEKDYIKSRKAVLVNSDCHISLAAPTTSMDDYFFKNADADEVIFIHKGTGKLLTMYGEIQFEYGDYLVIPRGTIYKLEFDDDNNRLFVVESFSPIRFPRRYLSNKGQLMEHAPFCERDLKKPENLQTIDDKGEFLFKIKKEGMVYPYTYEYHPFDVIGWDGYNYPYSFSIHDFEPITGRIHQPPPVHQTFAANGFVICSFVPRLFDYHPKSIPAPYNHSNIDSDELLYYVDGDFMSRKHVEHGMITLHPGGIPHGPHPGTYEGSIGKEKTEELAVMVDTFKPLQLTKLAFDIENKDYYQSWLEKEN